MKKFEFTGESYEQEMPVGVEAREHVTVYQIRALVDIPAHNVKKGDLGGWIEKEENLSHEGNCWLGNGVISGSSTVKGDILVGNHEEEARSCHIRGNSHINGSGLLSGVFVDNSIINGHIVSYDTCFDFSYLEGNIKAFEGLLKQCHIKSNGEKIVLFYCVLIPSSGRLKITNKDNKPLRLEHVRIDFEKGSGDHSINAFGEMKRVYSEDLSALSVHGHVDIECLDLEEKSSLHIPSCSKGVKIQGTSTQNPVCFTTGVKRICDSHIEGCVTLKGNITVIDSDISDYAEVQNHSEEEFSLERINMKDYTKLERFKDGQTELKDVVLVADEHLVLN